MFRIALSVLLVASLSACGESYAERDARYQVAKKECVESGVKTGFAQPGTFSRTHEAVAVKAIKDCLASRGFQAEADDMK